MGVQLIHEFSLYTSKQCTFLRTVSLCRGWVPETSLSFHYWWPAPRWRLHRWLAKPDNPTISPHAPEKTGTPHTGKWWKVEGVKGGEKPLNTPHTMLLLPATPTNKLYNPKHMESDACASIPKPLTTIGCSRSLLLTQLNFI